MPFVAEENGEGRISGYASLFDRPDQTGERVLRGAFSRTLAERGAGGVRMLWQHDPREPIGVWTRLFEDERGLRVEGRLALATQRGREVFELIRAGAVDGLSIGFRTRRASRDPRTGERRVNEVDLWEVSIVTFPMQSLARLAEMRGRALAASLTQSLKAAARRLSGQTLTART
ncbi:HK97 family phage prohead protease [Aureimonas mangrovi]|uniref:HK97 family phage prohead protease n=1 Tax=Aureimonas mangrovi TaxID=2758041 RepID=UPI00163D937B|nr:HK97 family phage prohead protease [Aureimonas mangrovi]